MTVKLKELLQLPSLQDSIVIAGKEGLDRDVSSVSVLESVDASLIDAPRINQLFFDIQMSANRENMNSFWVLYEIL